MSPIVPPAMETGAVIGGHYRLLEEIGRGAFGTVHRAVHVVDGREFAVKLLRSDLLRDPQARQGFLHEAAAVARLVHPGVAQVRHYGEEGGIVFLVLDLCTGETLHDLLAREGRLEPGRAADIAARVLDTLAVAHGAGIVHRDLKPSNVIVEERDEGLRVRIVDFGLALVVSDHRTRLARRDAPADASRVGTLGYMSPEQVRGDEVVDGRSDLFSVGAMLHEMVSGCSPFSSDAPFSTMLRILDAPPAPLPPPAGPLAPVIRRALEKDPDLRWPTAEAFAAATRAATAGSTAARAQGARGRSRWTIAVVATGLALALGIMVAWPAIRTSRARDAAARAFEEGRYADVLVALAPLLTTGNATGEDHLLAGRSRTELLDPDAVVDLDAARAALGNVPRVALARGRWLWTCRSDFVGALDALGTAVAGDARNPEPLRERALMVAMGVRGGDLPAERSRLAGRDADTLESRDPEDPWVPLLRALERHALVQRGTLPAEALDQVLADVERAERMGLGGSAADCLRFDVAFARGRAARVLGEPERAREHERAGLRALDEAIDAARVGQRDRPSIRSLSRLYEQRGSLRLLLGDREGATRDFLDAAGSEPRSAHWTISLAFGLRHAGRLDEALALYESLRTDATIAMLSKDAAWCRLRRSQRMAAAGDRDRAAVDASVAVSLFEDAVVLPERSASIREGPEPVALAYLAEAHVWASRLAETSSRRTEHLAEARAALDRAERIPPPNESRVQEVAFRRAEHSAVVGDLDGASAALERGIGEHRDLAPEWYERRGFCRLGFAARFYLAGKLADSVAPAKQAGEDFTYAARLRPLPSPVDAFGRALAVWLAGETTRSAAAEAAEVLAAVTAPDDDPEARLEAARCRRLRGHLALDRQAAAPLDRALLEDLASARWHGSRPYADALATALDAAGDTEGSFAARVEDAWLAP